MQFKDPFTGKPAIETAKGTDIKYHVEHVLEWQIVTGFFEWIAREKAKGAVFPNPTGGDKKVEFPAYFNATWGMDDVKEVRVKKGKKKADGSDDDGSDDEGAAGKEPLKIWSKAQRFQLEDDPNGPERTPREHLASVYPAAGNDYSDEFCFLEASVNSPAKTLVSLSNQTYFSFANICLIEGVRLKESVSG